MGLAYRPFPGFFHLGADVTSISRWVALLRKRLNGPDPLLTLTRRWMTPYEVHNVLAKYNAESALVSRGRHNAACKVLTEKQAKSIASHLAGRWAAKEAIIKATKPRRLTLRDIELRQDSTSGEVFGVIFDPPTPLWGRHQYDVLVTKPAELKRPQSSEILHSKDKTGVADNKSLERRGTVLSLESEFEYTEKLNGQVAQVTITHDGDYALAVALAVSTESASLGVP